MAQTFHGENEVEGPCRVGHGFPRFRNPWQLPTPVGGHHSLGATFLGSQGDLIVGIC